MGIVISIGLLLIALVLMFVSKAHGTAVQTMANVATIIATIVAVIMLILSFPSSPALSPAPPSAITGATALSPTQAPTVLSLSETRTITPTQTISEIPSASITPLPSPTLEDTPPGSILRTFVHSWQHNGVELRIGRLRRTESFLCISLIVSNEAMSDLNFGFSLENFSAIDNLGHHPQVFIHDPDTEETRAFFQDRVHIRSGVQLELPNTRECIYFDEDFSNPAFEELFVSVSNIAGIDKARWRIARKLFP